MKKKTDKNQIVSKKFDFRSFWVKIWKLLEPSRGQVTGLLVLLFFMEAVALISPYILKIIIDKVTHFDPAQLKIILVWVAVMFLSNEAVSFLGYVSDKKIFQVLADSINYIANQALQKMVFLDLGYHERENTGNKVVKINRGVDKIDNLFGSFFWDVAPTIFQVILTIATLFWINWIFGAVTLVFVPIFIFLTFKVNKRVFPFRTRRFDNEEVAAGLMTQSIININTVKSFVQEFREYRNFQKATGNVKDSLMEEYGHVMKFNLARNFVIDLGRGFILLFGIYSVVNGTITVGSLVFVYTISEKALLSLFRISRLYDRIMESADAVERLYDLSQEEPEIKNPENGINPKKIEGKIEFENVGFVYQESAVNALDGVSFQIAPGAVTALVGPSGGGKTTAVRMIYRHYDPSSGRVMLDGRDLKEYDLYGFRRFIAIVPQEVEIFNTSVAENIAYAKPEASSDEIRSAARIANAEEFITQLKEGYETLVGERGIKLSGGQRQRIGIARAVLADPRVLIFDEATSNLDSYSERLIQDAMENIRQNRTVIIIAHRLSTIKKADKIIVLEHGRVMEEGSHAQLAQVRGGLYRKLIDLQKMGEVD
jgi:ABC-type multidrug transport system fused ATPase/permease subunit